MYVHITNIGDDEEIVRIDLFGADRKARGIRNASVWVTDETRKYELAAEKTYPEPIAAISVDVPPYSVTTLKLAYGGAGRLGAEERIP